MRPHHLALLLLLTPLTAPAELTSPQVRTRQVTPTSHFWQSLREIFRGHRPQAEADLRVLVLDSANAPLRGALVLVGQKQGDPFPGNLQFTDEEGYAFFSDEQLRSAPPFPITASHPGFSVVSLVGNQQNNVEIQLPALPEEKDFGFLSGKMTGFPPGYGSGVLELGIFLPAFRAESLLNFDPQQLISSYTVKINIFGDREVPGNVVFPPQKKRYGFIPISLSKPEYIMPLPLGLRAHMGAMAGAVDISDAITPIRNKDYLGAVNLTRFTHIGWTNDRVTVRGNENFPLHSTHAIAPGLINAEMTRVPAGLDAVTMTFFDKAGDGGDFLPLDLKAIKSEAIREGKASIKLGVLQRRSEDDKFYVFTALFNRALFEDKKTTSRSIVGSLRAVDNNLHSNFPTFLGPIQSRGVSGENREFRFSSAARDGIVPNLVLVNIVSEKRNELTKGKTRRLLWSVVTTGDAEAVSLPDLGQPVLPPPDTAKGERFLWEVIAIKTASTAAGADLDIQSALRNLQHVSSLSEKF